MTRGPDRTMRAAAAGEEEADLSRQRAVWSHGRRRRALACTSSFVSFPQAVSVSFSTEFDCTSTVSSAPQSERSICVRPGHDVVGERANRLRRGQFLQGAGGGLMANDARAFFIKGR